MAKTIKLPYSSDWTEDDEKRIAKALELSEQQQDSLFTKHKAIEISQVQLEALNNLNEESGDDADDGTEADAPQGDTPTVPDTEHPDEDIIDVSIASQRDRDAVNMAVTLDAAFTKVFTEDYKARETIAIAPLFAMQAMIAAAKTNKKDLSELPVPNSRREKGITVVGTGDNKHELGSNAPWDKYTFQAQNDKGNMVKKQGSYYKSEFDASEVGKSIIAEIKSIDAAIAHLKDPSTGPAMPERYKGFQTPAMTRRKKLWDKRQSTGYTFLRKVVTLFQQTQAMDGLQKVRYSFDTEEQDGKQVFINRNEPVTLCDVYIDDKGKEREKNHTIYALTTFNKFNVGEAIAKAGGSEKVTLAHLQATVAREQAEEVKDDSKDDWSKHEIENVSQLENIFSSLSKYLTVESGDVNAKRIEALSKRFGEKDGEEALLVVGDTCLAMDAVWTKFQTEYQKAAAKRTQAQIAEREALARKNAA